jgi:ParB family chromosome partitioning protein
MDQTQSYNAEGKFTGVVILPENLTIVGIDCLPEEFPDIADPDRVNLPLDEAFVASIAEHGVRTPITIRKYNGDSRVFVVTGRRRVRAARLANAVLADDCKIRVKCLPEPKGMDSLATLIIENEGRVNDTPLARARKADRMRRRGDGDAKIAHAFSVTPGAVRSWWTLLEAPAAAQRAVEQGKITAAAAIEIGKLPPSEQGEALRVAVEAGRGSAAIENVRAMRKPRAAGDDEDGRPRRLSLAQMKAFAEALAPGMDDDTDFARKIMVAVLGGGAKELKDYPSVAKVLRRVLRPEREET